MKKIILSILCIISINLNAKVVALPENSQSTPADENRPVKMINGEKWFVMMSPSSTDDNIQKYVRSDGISCNSKSNIIIQINTDITNVSDLSDKFNIKFVRYMNTGDINSPIKEALFSNKSDEDSVNIINAIDNDSDIKIEKVFPDYIFNMQTQ
jgi:hypothetical protein